MGGKKDSEAPEWVVKLYGWLWIVVQALLVIAFLALCIWLRIGFDKWYINWLMK